MVWWWGHGSETVAYLGYEDCGWGIIMSTPDAPSLNDNYPSFVYQCSCLNGYPEDPNNLGTALLYNGAVATVSASRVSWYFIGSWYTGLKYICDNASIGYYYGGELVVNEKKAAVALYDVKSDMGINNSGGGQSWMNLFDFNLYGSPETYIIVKYDLTVSTVQGGTTSPSPATYTYPAGTEVSITATPDTNYRFSGWTGDVPEGHENDNPITITMDSNKSVKANFIRQYTLTIASGTGGTTDPSPGSHIYDVGTDVVITATPESGYRFGSWTGDVPTGHENDNPVTITMDSDKSIEANFIRQYILTIAAGTGGTTNPSPGSYIYDVGTQVSIRAIPNSGYRFTGWTGAETGTTNPITVTMDSDKSITASFTAISTGDEDGGGKKGGCFIATAAYGSLLHPYVKVLRDFRDRYLLPSKLGRKFVDFYYKYSPFLANIIARSESLKVIVGIHLVPFIVLSYSMIHLGPITTAGIFLFVLVLPILFVWPIKRKKSRLKAKSPKAMASLG